MKPRISRIAIIIMLMCVAAWANASDGPDQSEMVASTQGVKSPPEPTTAKSMLELGNTYEAGKDYSAALLWFNKVLSQHPDKALEANFSIGWCYQEQGKYAEAIAAYKSTIAYTSSKDEFYSKQARYNLGDCYRDAGEWDAAIAVYTQLAEDYPEDAADKILNVGGCYKGKKDYEKAIAIYNEVAEEYPNEKGAALFGIDDCFGDQQKNDDRLAHLNKMYDDLPDLRAEILFRLGLTRGGMKGEYEQSIADLEHMIADYPDFWRVAEAKAAIAEITLNRLRDAAQAKTLLEKFILEYPDYGDMMFVKLNLATCSYRERNYLEAASLFKDVFQYDDPANFYAVTLYLIGDCFMRIGDTDGAEQAFNKLKELFSTDPWVQIIPNASDNHVEH